MANPIDTVINRAATQSIFNHRLPHSFQGDRAEIDDSRLTVQLIPSTHGDLIVGDFRRGGTVGADVILLGVPQKCGQQFGHG